jgi:hypothetical protein
MNNVGTAKTLAEYTLSETDWTVESETFVQTIEEPLVYVTIAKDTPITRLRNSHSTYLESGLIPEESTLNKNITALAFYSSCRTRPHRF